MQALRSVLGTVVVLALAVPGLGQEQRVKRASAWETLLARDPEAADDPSIRWKERLILHVLTPEQAKAYFHKRADPHSLLLDNGQTLQEYLEARLSPQPSVFVPLPAPCSLFSYAEIQDDQNYGIRVRGSAMGTQGGSPDGCGIPPEATAVVLQLRGESLGDRGRVKLWAADGPEPVRPDIETAYGGSGTLQAMVIIPLARDGQEEADLRVRSTGTAEISGEVVGYFRALRAGDAPGQGVAYYTEDPDNNNSLFGAGAGTGITTGTFNSFFGWLAGAGTSSGVANSIFGAWSGYNNTAGFNNSFFGRSAGYGNSTGFDNSFFGYASGENTTSSENDFFGAYSGHENTTGSLNSFFGYGSGYSNTTGSEIASFGNLSGYSNTTGSFNAFFGAHAGYFNTTGASNALFGYRAGYANTTGSRNSYFGKEAGYFNTTGTDNAFFGHEAGHENRQGYSNSFFGTSSGYANTTGQQNAFFGWASGFSNTTGRDNAFVGYAAGFSNTTGQDNAFFGLASGGSNASGSRNAFAGKEAGYSNTTGNDNTFFGYDAGFAETEGYFNAFFGASAGYANTTGVDNAFFGYAAGFYNTTGQNNAFFGLAAGGSNTTEDDNTFIGAFSDGSAAISNSTAVGHQAQVSQSNSLVLGSIAGVNGATENVKVGIGTTAPSAALHVVRSDGTAMIKVEETLTTTANRVLFRLTNNGAPWFKLLNSNTSQEWTFAMDQFDNFIFSKIGTGGSEFKIYKSGEVTMGPGGSEVFDLQPTGDLEIAGSLTAGGIYYASDRNKKTDIEPLDSETVLETIARLPVSTWRFKTEDPQIRHAGPMAQDFYAAFRLGSDDKSINA
ncbi:MAG: tail fiber domain-containing protein, partial [Desulfatiglandaceae bacterium]